MVAERRLTDDQLQVMADKLIGTVDGIEVGLEATLDRENDGLDEMSLADCQHFDTLAFLCAECGWWFAIEDLGDADTDQRCKECSEHEEEWTI